MYKMKFGFNDTVLHKAKILVTATCINHSYGEGLLWKQPMNMEVLSGGEKI